jgi:tetratricopeptide (TPR) repeat protein
VALLAAALAFGAARVQAATDAREIKAREDFAAGRFQDALDIFARLYAESLHPNYLRNIARCYQNLGQPDRAISTFRDYLHKAKDLTPDERKEVEGYIKEMEDLKREREGEAQPATPSPLPAAPEPAPAAAATPAATQVVVVNTPEATPPAETPIYAKWWFWTLIGGAAIAAGVGIAAATGAFTKTQNATCPTSAGFMCPQ